MAVLGIPLDSRLFGRRRGFQRSWTTSINARTGHRQARCCVILNPAQFDSRTPEPRTREPSILQHLHHMLPAPIIPCRHRRQGEDADPLRRLLRERHRWVGAAFAEGVVLADVLHVGMAKPEFA